MQNRLSELVPYSVAVNADVVIEPTLEGAAADLLARAGLTEKKLALVCDANTHAALGGRLMSELSALSPALVLLETTPHADEPTVEKLRAAGAEGFIAVGSGTISDLCKYASFKDGKPYVVFPTAPSMNGYLSANASIMVNGVKETHAAHLPHGVFCDLGVLAAAPKQLIRSGLGDSLCRPTAQADWLLSHLLFDTPYDSLPFTLLARYEKDLFARSEQLMAGDKAVIQLLMQTLLVSGIGMVIAKGSYPASQGEHLIVHAMEMMHGASQHYHGEQVGVATLTMAKIQETVMVKPIRLSKRTSATKAIAGYFGLKLAKQVASASREKLKMQEERHNEINTRLEKGKDIRGQIREILIPEAQLRKVLTLAGAPTKPADLGLNEKEYDAAVQHACYIRDRFTFLDLV